jgi:hypothetical protein
MRNADLGPTRSFRARLRAGGDRRWLVAMVALSLLACGKVTEATDAGTGVDADVVDAVGPVDGADPIDAASCFPNPCLNGGTCGDTTGGPVCTCINGFAGSTCQTQVGPLTFRFTGAQQTWLVPEGVHTVTVDARGGSGGDGWNVDGGGSVKGIGGNGGQVQATLAVTPGETLEIFVGGAGMNATTLPGSGGYNGGGNGADSPFGYAGGGGGGATDLRRGGVALTDRIIVAAGGGSGSGWCTAGTGNGGAGGDLIGANGQDCVGNVGTGGTQNGGGTINGAFGIGGGTGLMGQGSNAGSAGGGGWYGGGASNGSGGGGGSSYAAPGITGVTHTQGANDGNGIVTISW